MKNKILIVLTGLFLLVAGGLTVAYWIWNDPLPKGEQGEEADAMARKMMEAVNISAWENTAAVSWVFADRNRHLWDRERHFARVEWDKNEVWVDLNTVKGVAFSGGKKVEGEAGSALIEEAWKRWVNDSFWLNPIAKLFDPGTERRKVEMSDGRLALLITYTSGGVTPGDSYLWFYGREGLPEQWKLWVSIIPVGGIAFTWEEWITLPTGAKISTLHKGPIELRLTEVAGDTTLSALLPGEDPFALLDTLGGI